MLAARGGGGNRVWWLMPSQPCPGEGERQLDQECHGVCQAVSVSALWGYQGGGGWCLEAVTPAYHEHQCCPWHATAFA
eukprot:360894-Chlamydomonas_euryale.AAC.9